MILAYAAEPSSLPHKRPDSQVGNPAWQPSNAITTSLLQNCTTMMRVNHHFNALDPLICYFRETELFGVFGAMFTAQSRVHPYGFDLLKGTFIDNRMHFALTTKIRVTMRGVATRAIGMSFASWVSRFVVRFDALTEMTISVSFWDDNEVEGFRREARLLIRKQLLRARKSVNVVFAETM